MKEEWYSLTPMKRDADPRELKGVYLYLASDASATAVQSLIDAVGSSLHDLSIGFSDVRDPTGALCYSLVQTEL